jgi:hypothetical protein
MNQHEKSDVVVISQPPAYQGHTGGDKKATKFSANVKVIALSVTAVIITALVVMGFVLAFRYHADTTGKLANHNHDSNKQVITDAGGEEIIEEPDEFTKLYTVRTESGTYKVLYDFNRNIRVMKKDAHCIVVPMNSSEEDPDTRYRNGADPEEATTIYKRDNVPIKDTSVMGQTGQEMCKDELVYWAFPTCAASEDHDMTRNATGVEPSSRAKRAIINTHVYWGGSCPPQTHSCTPTRAGWCCMQCGTYVLSSSCVELYLLRRCDTNTGACWWHCHFVYGC